MPISKIFREKFQKEPERKYWSSGRVNIIGEHSDYHDGLVMPAAINLGITWVVAKNGDYVRGYTEKFDEVGEFKINQKSRTEFEWMLYLQGVVETLKKWGKKFGGAEFAIHSTIPIGSGLSSSSSLATGFTFILNDLYNLGLNRKQIAKVACEAEWWYGTTGGIMDQYCIANGRAGKAIFLDCRELEHEEIKIPKDLEIVVFETTIRHKQINSPFDLRKRQAREALEILREKFPSKDIKQLRDVTLAELESIKSELIRKFGKTEGNIIFKRARHPITENERVLKMKKALIKRDFSEIGRLLDECYNSLKNDYEVSCEEIDKAIEVAKTIEGLVGTRMVGGGFGGCTINLVKRGTSHHFAGEIEEKFRKETGIKGNAYICNPSDGLKELKM